MVLQLRVFVPFLQEAIRWIFCVVPKTVCSAALLANASDVKDRKPTAAFLLWCG